MSLNWREIDAILAELDLPGSHIQEVIQPDFHNLYFAIFRPGRRSYLRICLETGKTRIHATDRKPRKPAKRQRFAQLLHSRIRGALIAEARQLNADRIVRLDLARAGERSLLWIRLWGGAANCLVTDEHGEILDAFYRRPKRGETTGETFFVDDEEVDPESDPRKSRFISRWTTDVNESVRAHYGEEEVQEERERLAATIRAAGERTASAARRRLEGVRRKLGSPDDADRLQTFGDLVTANLHRIERGAARVEAEDYTRDGELVSIELDPTRSAHENAERYYARAQKARRSRANLEEELSVLERTIEDAERSSENLESLDLAELRARAGDSRETQPQKAGESSPGLTFTSHGFTILVGRNSRENDELLRRHVRGNDTWLHVRDYPGGYVFVRAKPGKSVPLEVLLDAGNLAIHYSKAKSNGRADLFYTQVKYLRRAKDGPRGLVLPTQEKNLHVVVEEKRIERLLGRD